jgi:bifunctional non-homologous end joining protein LigD
MAKLTEYKRKRNFDRTAEPSGDTAAHTSHKKLRFVIQKHAASHLHYDFRLELEGVMKSWAVPKGPSTSTSVKRLAMEVEDHPIEYNKFEGTIPQGEYGGGTVMLWDRGTYTADEAEPGDDVEAVLKREYKAGKMSITLEGERLQGSWALVRTDPGPKPKWLLIKHRDRHARDYEATDEFVTSVVTDRTMEEIAGGKRVWHSNRKAAPASKSSKRAAKTGSTAMILPTRPQSARTLPDEDRVFMPWHGGERVLAFATAEACTLIDTAGRDRTTAHAELSKALAGLSRRAGQSFVLDAEIVADTGEMFALDLIFAGDESFAHMPWKKRRDKLAALFRRRRVPSVALAQTFVDGDRLLDRAADEEWRGILAVDPAAPYTPGKRTRDWLAISAPSAD